MLDRFLIIIFSYAQALTSYKLVFNKHAGIKNTSLSDLQQKRLIVQTVPILIFVLSFLTLYFIIIMEFVFKATYWLINIYF